MALRRALAIAAFASACGHHADPSPSERPTLSRALAPLCVPPATKPTALLAPDPRVSWSGAVAVFAGTIARWWIDGVERKPPRPDRPYTAFDTRALADGPHTLALDVLGDDSLLEKVSTTFCVDNAVAAPRFSGAFVDVTASSGLDALLGYTNEASHGSFLGAVSGDFDADGDVDLFVWDRAGARFWMQQSPWSFTPVGETYPGVHAAGVGDLDGDGDPDLVAVGDRVAILRNDAGTFVDVTAASGLSTTSDGAFRAVTLADVDMDGLLDVALTQLGCSEAKPTPPLLLRNEGELHFVDVASELGLAGRDAEGFGVAIDVLDDGATHAWLFHEGCVSGATRHVRLVPGTDLPTIVGAAPPPITIAPMGSAWLDADGDGALDLLLAGDVTSPLLRAPGFERSLAPHVGLDAFVDATSAPVSAWSPALLDVDLDGRPDVFVVHHPSDPNTGAQESSRDALFWQAAPGRFVDVAPRLGLGGVARCRAVQGIDLDRDGDTDLVVGCLDRLRVLRNDVVAAGAGRTLVLHGTVSNADGVHAIVRTSSEARLVRGGGQPYAGGVVRESVRAGALSIRWPSGLVQQVAAGARPLLDVREPLSLDVAPRRVSADGVVPVQIAIGGALGPVEVRPSAGTWVSPMTLGADGIARGTLLPPAKPTTIVLEVRVGTTTLTVRPRIYVR